MMKVVRNPENYNRLEMKVPAVLTYVSPGTIAKKANGVEFHKAKANVTYPDGSVDEVDTIIYAVSYAKFPKEFEIGQPVTLTVNMEDDEYKGRSTASLPGGTDKRVNFAAFELEMVDTEATPTTA